VTALIRSLPKDLRRPLVPVPEVAAAVLARVKPRSEPLLAALARELEALRSVRIPPDAWALDRLPPHLRMTFRVEDERGALVAEGDDLDALREAVRPRLRAALSSAAAPLEHSGLTDWTIGTLPRTVALPGTGQAVRGYPSLVDEGATVGVRVLETPEAQREAMHAGTRKLLALNVPSPIRHVQGRLPSAAQLTLAAAPHTSPRAVLEDATVAALEALMAEAGGPAWDAAGFARVRAHVAGHLADRTAEAVRQAVRILDAAREVERRLEPLARAAALAPAREDVERQLRRLVHPGFITRAGVRRLADVERYLQAAARRLERLPNAPAPDLDKMRRVHELEREYEARVASWPPGRPLPAALREVPWQLEELRVSHFAQSLGARGAVSAKRIRKQILDAAP
jgi:ATP-dependent helicase HrpA